MIITGSLIISKSLVENALSITGSTAFSGSTFTVGGNIISRGYISSSGFISASAIATTYISASSYISSSMFYGNGSGLTGLSVDSLSTVTVPKGGTGADSFTANGIVYVNATADKFLSHTTKGLIYFDGAIKSLTDTNASSRLVYMKYNAGGGGYVYPSSSNLLQDNNGLMGYGTTLAPYNFYIDGTLAVKDTITELSTRAIKTNIVELGDELSKIKQLIPVEFDYIDTNRHSIGFIAEEFVNTYPDLVANDENGEPHSIAYSNLVSPIVKAIQQLSKKLDELENRIEMLENK